MLVEQFRTGGDRNFGYLAADESSRKAVVIDPSYSPDLIIKSAREKKFDILYAFCTHNHYDHTNGNDAFFHQTGIKPLLYGNREPVTGVLVEDGAEFPLGKMEISVIYSPGHTADAICLVTGNAVFTGDTLFVGKVGGTGLGEDARQEYEALHQKLMTLPDNTRVFPGHDYGTATESTIARERSTNPFLLRPDFESFVELKRNWAAYKREHGIA